VGPPPPLLPTAFFPFFFSAPLFQRIDPFIPRTAPGVPVFRASLTRLPFLPPAVRACLRQRRSALLSFLCLCVPAAVTSFQRRSRIAVFLYRGFFNCESRSLSSVPACLYLPFFGIAAVVLRNTLFRREEPRRPLFFRACVPSRAVESVFCLQREAAFLGVFFAPIGCFLRASKFLHSAFL